MWKDKDAERAYQRAYRAAHADELREKAKIHRQKNRAQRLETGRAYAAAHKDKIRDYGRAYRAKNAARIKARKRQYSQENRQKNGGKLREKQRAYYRIQYAKPHKYYAARRRAYRHAAAEKWREYGRCWHVQNTERVKSYARTRRALERGATVRDFTAAQWLAMQEQYNHRCVYCPPNCWRCQRKRHALTQDHIVPFSKGGNHTWSNIVPACKSCNSKKHTGPILSPVQSLLFLLPEP